MKKLLSTLAIAAASTALAVESSNTFGILRVDSSAAQTIVSVPWEGAGATGEGAGKIKVKDVVKTANLTKGTDAQGTGGDQLYYYANGSYKLWLLNNVGEWVGANVAKIDENDTKTIEASAGGEDTLTRGGAIILVRKNTANPFYLYGQYTASEATLNVARGTAETPAYSLVAPSKTTDTALDSLANANVDENDTVIVKDSSGNMRVLSCRNTASDEDPVYKWGNVRNIFGTETFTAVEVTVPAGEGFWYISRGGSINPPAQN